ncbi:MAG: energy transducer TonB [Verrucomicrobiota bacterium JB022]|nr:energy transducer TonB [Verrucomicrobiota bacterium JB022]
MKLLPILLCLCALTSSLLAQAGRIEQVRNANGSLWLDLATSSNDEYRLAYLRPGDRNWTVDDSTRFKARGSTHTFPLPTHLQNASQAVYFYLQTYSAMPKMIGRPNIQYPLDMKYQLKEGEVVVKFVIQSDGTVGQIIVESSTHESFTNAVLPALRELRYTPMVKEARTVNVWVRQPFPFNLR